MTHTFHLCEHKTVLGFEAGVWDVFGELLRRSDGQPLRDIVGWLNESEVDYVVHASKTKMRKGYQSKYDRRTPARAALFQYTVTLIDDASAIQFRMVFPDHAAISDSLANCS